MLIERACSEQGLFGGKGDVVYANALSLAGIRERRLLDKADRPKGKDVVDKGDLVGRSLCLSKDWQCVVKGKPRMDWSLILSFFWVFFPSHNFYFLSRPCLLEVWFRSLNRIRSFSSEGDEWGAKSKNVVFPARRHPSIHVSFPYASAYSKSTYPGSPNPTGSLSFKIDSVTSREEQGIPIASWLVLFIRLSSDPEFNTRVSFFSSWVWLLPDVT